MINNWLSKRQRTMRSNRRKGFTLMELIIVLIVLAIIGAVLIPSMVGFIWHGQQINRMNVARTLYISMQNQLTRHMLEGNLREVLTSHFYATDLDDNLIVDEDTGYFQLRPGLQTVAELLSANGGEYPERDEINEDFVFHIIKPRDFAPLPAGHPDRTAQHDFYDLLDNIIINKDILSDAFLMEVNIRTGVVLSIFYGDNIGRGRQGTFEYADVDNDVNTNVTGSRGMGAGGYEFDYDRAQGYYGVDWTGEPALIPLPDIIDIYDGKNSDRDLEGRVNVLYAELFIPTNTDSLLFELDLVSAGSRTSVRNTDEFPNPIIVDLTAAKTAANRTTLNETLNIYNTIVSDTRLNGHLIYYPTYLDAQTFDIDSFGINVGPLYDKFIWVLDCVYGDLIRGQGAINPNGPLNAQITINKYIDASENDPQFIRAALTRRAGININSQVFSLTTDHSHFGGELSTGILSPINNRYTVSSARHLSNIRHFPNLNTEFRQTEDINLAEDNVLIMPMPLVPGPVLNFKPINNFGGTYNSIAVAPNVNRPRILNLTIDVDVVNDFAPVIDPVNIGLFAEVTGTGEVNGISIFEARITATGTRNANVGAIAGSNSGTIRFSNSYSNILRGSTTGSNTGGLVGFNAAGGVIDQSFNAGFFDTHRQDTNDNYLTSSNTPGSFGSVRASAGNVGGLTGSNSGVISNSYNNARVNIDDIEEMVLPPSPPLDSPFRLSKGPISTGPDGGITGNIGGITGQNNATGTINRVYATNFVGEGTTFGGIAGVNNNISPTAITNAFYLRNGVANNIGQEQAKDDLWSQEDILWRQVGLPGDPPVRTPFEPGLITGAQYELDPGNNSYERYPYPVLTNNRPFTGTTGEWGWEDIEGEDAFAGALVYYEFYTEIVNEEPVPRDRRYNSPFLTAPSRIIPENSIQAQTWLVHHDGYAIEFLPYSGGYLLQFGETAPEPGDTAPGDPIYYRIIEVASQWRVVPFDSVGNVPDPAWLPAEEFTPTAGLDPELLADNPVMYRIYIPNELALERANSPITVALSVGTNLDNKENILRTVDPGIINEYNPWFANFSQGTEANPGIIRSARHFDNINLNLAANSTSRIGTYIQHLNIDFVIAYYEEITGVSGRTVVYDRNDIFDVQLRTFNRNAVVNAVFTGSYSGTTDGTETGIPRLISNLTIDTTDVNFDNDNFNTDNVGLFSVNNGTIQYVTLRNPRIIGSTNVGTIAGSNERVITNCSVQQTVPAAADTRYHPVTVNGVMNVGGVVGYNSGSLTNIVFMSTSNRPAAQGTQNVGGIVGRTVNADSEDVNALLFLAVAPVQGTGTTAQLHPYYGSSSNAGNAIGEDTYFLAGNRAMRPYQFTYISAAATTPLITYNIHLSSQQGESGNTWAIYNSLRTDLWDDWSIVNANMTPEVVEERPATGPLPYPYPNGTVIFQPANRNDWPLVIDPPPVFPNIAYYEKYADGTSGIFVRNADGTVLVDLLNPLGVIVECGYVFRPYSQIETGSSNFWISETGQAPWREYQFRTNFSPELEGVQDLQGTYRIMMFNSFVDYYALANIDPARVIYVAIHHSGNVNNAFLAVAMNPLFAKEIYEVTISNGVVPVSQRPAQTNTYYIHTPWHMQNISKIMEATNSIGRTFEFIQNRDINFGSTQLLAGVSLVDPNAPQVGGAYPAVPRPVGWTVNYTAAAEQGNGTSAVVNNGLTTTGSDTAVVRPTANIVRGNFAGTFDGNFRNISNLTLTNNSTATPPSPPANQPPFRDNKGLFNTISGTVDNVTLIGFTISNGNNNGGLASTVAVNGLVSNVAVRNYAPPGNSYVISGVNNTAGLVSTNSGTIRNVTMNGSTISGTGTGNNTAGIVSANNGNGTVQNITMTGCIITGTGNNTAGIVSANNGNGTVQNTTMTGCTITGTGIGTAGVVSVNNSMIQNVNVINCSISATGINSDTAGAVSTNSGTIEIVTLIGCTITATGINSGTAGVVSINELDSTISDISFIDNRAATNTTTPASPIIGTDAAGIVNVNSGIAENILFIARAPEVSQNGAPVTAADPVGVPITATDPDSLVSNAYYLSGTVNGAASPGNIINFNNYIADVGTPLTTQELNALSRQNPNGLGFAMPPWAQATVPVTANTMTSTAYPYPFLPNTIAGLSFRPQWPVATIEALRIAYYEIYEDGSMGFFAPAQSEGGLPEIDTLDDTNTRTVRETGYCAIVPRAGGYSIKIGSGGSNSHLQSAAAGSFNFVIIPPTMFTGVSPYTGILPFEIYVNDQTTGSFINTYFAKAVYASYEAATTASTIYIRTPQQLQNIRYWTGANRTLGVTFLQDRDMDFVLDVGGSSFTAVTGTFDGTYDGSGNKIINLSINAGNAITNVGMFGTNSGDIKDLTFDFNGTGISATAANASIGVVTGTNYGDISGITINLYDALVDAVNVASYITAAYGYDPNVGVVAGTNNGDINNIEVNLNNATNISASSSGASIGAVAGTNNGDINLITLNINDTSSITSTGNNASVGGIAGTNSGTISEILVVFNGQSSVSVSYTGSSPYVGYVGGIAGTSLADAVISDITIVSNLVEIDIIDADATPPDVEVTALVPVIGAQAGGVAGSNAGDISRVLYLAPAPNDGTETDPATEIYPIVYTDNTVSPYVYTNVYYLSEFGTGPFNAGIIDSAGLVTVLDSGYDYTGLTASIGTPGNTDGINTAIGTSWNTAVSPAVWTNAVTPITDYTVYPYPSLVNIPPSQPAAWPVVTVSVLPASAILSLGEDIELYEAEPDEPDADDSELDEPEPEDPEAEDKDDDAGDEDTTNDDEIPGNTDELPPEEATDEQDDGAGNGNADELPVESDAAILTDDILIAAGVLTIFGGGYGFTKTEPFKSMLRRSSARAVRRINAQNDRKRRRK